MSGSLISHFRHFGPPLFQRIRRNILHLSQYCPRTKHNQIRSATDYTVVTTLKMSFAARPLLCQIVRRAALPGKFLAKQQTRSAAALAATISARAAGDEKEWSRPPMALMAATGAALAATLWQEHKSTDCCGIAGVVGNKNSLDARYGFVETRWTHHCLHQYHD